MYQNAVKGAYKAILRVREYGLYYLQSRYYNPETGRFLNADKFASTGQGILGNNMFTYCGNNPVCFTDSTGRRMVCAFNAELSWKADYIHDQKDESVGSIELGSATVSHGGCGPVAVYNAMQILGKTGVLFEDVLSYYEDNNGYLLDGYLGTSVYTCISYFEDQGYTVVATRDVINSAEYARYADASILWCWFDTISFPYLGAHFMAFEQIGTYGVY